MTATPAWYDQCPYIWRGGNYQAQEVTGMARRPEPVTDLIGPAVEQTLAALDLKPEDTAAAQLARRIAATIDDTPPGEERGKTLWHLAPQLLAALKELGATPAARAALTAQKPTDGQTPKSALAALRDAHRATRGA